ncbi:elongation factor tu GTP binding domain-containing protein [Ditylenchus destructor]|uniref:Eukaryotic translation initiation factor 5B n=1 Tax=Ditylenchus destructor TaxID=166010 RepID=A0AAD4NIN6_9BILA|nr:elongation factor tu GTP binding domain-containing protein [Ditylenchus destructor]
MLRKKEEAENEARRLAEEEEMRQEAARKAREEEEKKILEKKEEAKRKKVELIARQKKEGTFLTKKQKAQASEAARKLLQNKDLIVPSLVQDGEEKPKKPYYGKKKPPKKAAPSAEKEIDEQAVDEAPNEPSTAAEDQVEEEERHSPEIDETVDDWEKIVEIEDESERSTPVPVIASVESAKAELRTDGNIKAEPGEEEETESSEEEDAVSSIVSSKETKEAVFARVRAKLSKRRETAEAKKNVDILRSPIICVLGHVDTGKTKMLDTIRRTNVQDGEAGGITQQIGATRVPDQAIRERCRMVKDFNLDSIKIPGFLIIDTPGHESFANLRNRGSSLCDIAILVVDIMHGLEPQTIESLKLLLKRQTPFVVALNKVDRLYNYESNPRKDIWQHLKAQPQNTQMEFKERFNKIVGEFAEQGLNVALSNKNNDFDEYISVVPTSAFLGDGIGNLMAHIVEQCQNRLRNNLVFCEELDCTVMEVRSLPGLGTTIDVILVNGTLHTNDAIVLTGIDGAIITTIRDLLMPQPLKEIRVKNDYDHYKEIRGSQGVKVLAKNLEKAVAGLPIFVAHSPDELDVLKEDAEEQLHKALTSIKKKAEGVYVQASTLGSLEALLEFLKTQKIPYSNVNIGPVHKKDVQKAAAMLVHNAEFACILAFDVPVDREVQLFADREGVRIFKADIIYHLEDSFLKYREELRLKRRKDHEHLAIFPCKLRVLPQHVFNARNPIVCGVSVEAGHLKKGTPISAKTKDECIFLGTVMTIEKNHEQVDFAKAGDEVCVKIENTTGDAPRLYGRHFTHEDPLISRLTRESIDVCKTYFREDLSKADWQLVIQLKKNLDIL